MMQRIRRARKAPEPMDTEAFVSDMRDARCDALTRSRETIRRTQQWSRVLTDGGVDYDELNRVLFGRAGWPREEEGDA